jgi:hypothetical protein
MLRWRGWNGTRSTQDGEPLLKKFSALVVSQDCGFFPDLSYPANELSLLAEPFNSRHSTLKAYRQNPFDELRLKGGVVVRLTKPHNEIES